MQGRSHASLACRRAGHDCFSRSCRQGIDGTFGDWFAEPEIVLMRADHDAPFFFYADVDLADVVAFMPGKVALSHTGAARSSPEPRPRQGRRLSPQGSLWPLGLAMEGHNLVLVDFGAGRTLSHRKISRHTHI